MTDLQEYFAQFTTFRNFSYVPSDVLHSLELDLNCDQYEVWRIIDIWWTEFKGLSSDQLRSKTNSDCPQKDVAAWEKLHISTNIDSDNEKGPLLFEFCPNGYLPHKNPWKLNQIRRGELDQSVAIEGRASAQLFRLSYWSEFDKQIATLAALALPESWSLGSAPRDRFFVLKSYIKYTFAKANADKLIWISEDGKYAVFNTGLVDKNYGYIYVVFDASRTSDPDKAPWIFNSFCIAGKGREGRLLSDNFRDLPPAVKYFSQISDISYIFTDKEKPADQAPDLQMDHFANKLDRFPLAFVKDIFRFNSEALEKLKNVPTKDSPQNKAFWSGLSEILQGDAKAYDNFSTAVNQAVRKAVLRASWNYRTAIPSYFPTQDKMSILLPLSFVTDDHAEVALVVEKKKASDKYTAPTVLNLAKAYSNSRLVCRIESDWLNPSLISDDVDSDCLTESEDADED